jgi:site-specific recombinase XerD
MGNSWSTAETIGHPIRPFWRTLASSLMRPYLLHKGVSLREIADFLGHSNMNSVSIYAKHNLHSLRQVASLNLSGLI